MRWQQDSNLHHDLNRICIICCCDFFGKIYHLTLNNSMAFIYAIKNLSNNKMYIGSSKSPIRRKYEHFYHLKKGRHHSIHLQNSYNVYGKELFSFYIIEECLDFERLEKEVFYINYHNTHLREFGYNIHEPNEDKFSCSDETKAKILDARKDKIAVDLYRTDGTFIGKFPSLASCETYCGFSPSGCFGRILKGKARSYKGYTVTLPNEPFTYVKSSKVRDMSKFYRK